MKIRAARDTGCGDSWWNGVIAATLTPFDAEGDPHVEAFTGYLDQLARTGVSAFAVGAHTGRGQLLPPAAHARLVAVAAASGLPVVATAYAPLHASGSRSEYERLLLSCAEVSTAGAAAVLCMPPPAVLAPDPTWTAQLHRRLGEVTGLPVIGFLLYSAAAANITYGTDHLRALADAGVAAVKIATLDDAVTSQDAIVYLRSHAPHVRVLTGEDRMFGPSLMWGATGVLAGIAGVRADLSVDLLQSWQDGQLSDFVVASERLDAFARLTFTVPIAGYVQRLAWTAAHDGILGAEFSYDPLATAEVTREREALLRALVALDRAHGAGNHAQDR